MCLPCEHDSVGPAVAACCRIQPDLNDDDLDVPRAVEVESPTCDSGDRNRGDVCSSGLSGQHDRSAVLVEDTLAFADAPRATGTPGPSGGQVTSEVGGANCGHTHADPNCLLGCFYATHVARAIEAAFAGDRHSATAHATVADRTLWVLGDIDDPEILRDFVGGLANQFDNYLRTLSLSIPT